MMTPLFPQHIQVKAHKMVGSNMNASEKCGIPVYPSSRQLKGGNVWRFPKMGLAQNHPFLIGISIINQPFWGPI